MILNVVYRFGEMAESTVYHEFINFYNRYSLSTYQVLGILW